MNIHQESSQFCHHIRSLQKSKGSPNNSIVLSYEQLCTPVLNNVLSFPFLQYNEYDFTTFPIIRFLNYLSNHIWSYGHFRVLLTFRRQDELLASLYSQMSNRICRASQGDFEKRLDKYINYGGVYIDWSKWIDELYHVFSHDSICLLFMEDMSTYKFWQDLSAFIGETTFSEEDLSRLTSMVKNRRRLSSDTWEIRPLKDITRHTLKRKWPASHDSYVRSLSFGAASCIDTLCCPFLRLAFQTQRGNTISLTPELVGRLRDYIAPFNERLSQQLNRDVASLGY